MQQLVPSIYILFEDSEILKSYLLDLVDSYNKNVKLLIDFIIFKDDYIYYKDSKIQIKDLVKDINIQSYKKNYQYFLKSKFLIRDVLIEVIEKVRKRNSIEIIRELGYEVREQVDINIIAPIFTPIASSVIDIILQEALYLNNKRFSNLILNSNLFLLLPDLFKQDFPDFFIRNIAYVRSYIFFKELEQNLLNYKKHYGFDTLPVKNLFLFSSMNEDSEYIGQFKDIAKFLPYIFSIFLFSYFLKNLTVKDFSKGNIYGSLGFTKWIYNFNKLILNFKLYFYDVIFTQILNQNKKSDDIDSLVEKFSRDFISNWKDKILSKLLSKLHLSDINFSLSDYRSFIREIERKEKDFFETQLPSYIENLKVNFKDYELLIKDNLDKSIYDYLNLNYSINDIILFLKKINYNNYDEKKSLTYLKALSNYSLDFVNKKFKLQEKEDRLNELKDKILNIDKNLDEINNKLEDRDVTEIEKEELSIKKDKILKQRGEFIKERDLLISLIQDFKLNFSDNAYKVLNSIKEILKTQHKNNLKLKQKKLESLYKDYISKKDELYKLKDESSSSSDFFNVFFSFSFFSFIYVITTYIIFPSIFSPISFIFFVPFFIGLPLSFLSLKVGKKNIDNERINYIKGLIDNIEKEANEIALSIKKLEEEYIESIFQLYIYINLYSVTKDLSIYTEKQSEGLKEFLERVKIKSKDIKKQLNSISKDSTIEGFIKNLILFDDIKFLLNDLKSKGLIKLDNFIYEKSKLYNYIKEFIESRQFTALDRDISELLAIIENEYKSFTIDDYLNVLNNNLVEERILRYFKETKAFLSFQKEMVDMQTLKFVGVKDKDNSYIKDILTKNNISAEFYCLGIDMADKEVLSIALIDRISKESIGILQEAKDRYDNFTEDKKELFLFES